MYFGAGALVLFSILPLLALIESQSFLSHEDLELPECDVATVPHNVLINPSSRPLLIFTSLLDYMQYQNQWSSNFKHNVLVLLSDAELNVANQKILFTLIRKGHTLALGTNLTKENDLDTELLNSLGGFETFTGFIPPFYYLGQPIANVTAPSFQLQLPTFPSNPNILQDQVALDFSIRHRHDSHISASVFDFLTKAQLFCLLSRLECHLVSPTDLKFRFCRLATESLTRESFISRGMGRLAPLQRHEELVDEDAGTSFMRKRATVAKVVRLSLEQVPERYVRALLFNPDLVNEHDSSDIFSTGILASLIGKFGKCCMVFSMLLYIFAVLDFLSHNLAMQKNLRQCGLFYREQIIPQLSRIIGDRAKLV